MLDYHSIGNRIRKYHKRCGYTQEELGLSIDTSGPYINNIERAVKKPSLENLADIAEVLGVTLNDLVSPPEADDDYRKDIETVIRHGFRFFLILYRRYAPVAYSLLSLVHSFVHLQPRWFSKRPKMTICLSVSAGDICRPKNDFFLFFFFF